MNKPPIDPRIRRGMEAQHKMREERLTSGDKHLGWKIGFGSPSAMERLGIEAPLIGFLTESVQLSSGESISITGWDKPAVEPEIALYLSQDIPSSSDQETIKAAIGRLGPAIEIADVNPATTDVEDILAGNIFNRHVILGQADPSRARAALDGLAGQVSRSEAEIDVPDDLQALTGNLINLVQNVADTLAVFGEGLRSGDVIIMGSIIPPIWVSVGDEIRYSLEPIDTISAKLV